jgi:mannose-6-phosphate isomerase-like protein (cupin superfamily)
MIENNFGNSSGNLGVPNQESSTQFVFSTDNTRRYLFPTHINDLVIDRANSKFSEVFVVIIAPDEAPLYHKHEDTEQVFYILEGEGVLTIGDERQQFRVIPGDVVRVPLSTLHSVKADKKNTLKYLCIDCFGEKPVDEPTWDAHVLTVCRTNGWNYNEVIQNP